MKFPIKVLLVTASIMPYVIFARHLKSEVVNAMHKGAMAEIRLKVLDDKGVSVTNASVRVVMDTPTGEHSMFGKTDTSGMYVAKGKTNGNYIEFWVGKDGYYGTRKKITYIQMHEEHDVNEGKWQPYGAEEIIELRKIRNPQPLSVAIMRDFRNTKAINTWLGFDLNIRDFVQPYGKGKTTDFEVFFDWDGKWLPDYKGMGVRIRFLDRYAGYLQQGKAVHSELAGPYSARVDLPYAKSAEFYERILSSIERDIHKFDQQKCWVVRSRCKVDDKGQLTAANYSVIHNMTFSCEPDGVAGLCVMGVFNPTPNDTNLEPKR